MNIRTNASYNVQQIEPATKPEAAESKIKTNVVSQQTTNSTDIKQAIDEATGVLQTIVSEPLSDKILRKIPPDEYLKMLTLLDKMISGSIDKEV